YVPRPSPREGACRTRAGCCRTRDRPRACRGARRSGMMERERRGSASSRERPGSDGPRPATGSGPAGQGAQTGSVQQAVAQRPIAGLPANYGQVLRDIKARVRESQARAATVVNRELIALYLHIGGLLSTQAGAAEWGDKVVERLATDLRLAFPSMSGFSRRNLFYMRQVYEAWADAEESVRQAGGQIPRGPHPGLAAQGRPPGRPALHLPP